MWYAMPLDRLPRAVELEMYFRAFASCALPVPKSESLRIMMQFRSFFALSVVVSLAAAIVLATSTCSRADVEPKRVLMLQSFGLRFKPWTDYAETFRSEMTRQSKVPIDFNDQSLLIARLDDDKSDAPFVDYLHSLYAEKPPDLIVALGAPAANFVQRYRPRIFPKAPMLFYAVEARRVQYDQLTENDTVAAVAHDFPLAVETILQVLPDTKVIAVVNGASPNEVFWQGVLERELAPLSGRVELRWYNRLSFEDILKDAANLPPHSAIFWHLMSVDATGVVHEANTALNRLSSAANAPIFSYLDIFFSGSIVGGRMHSVEEGSAVAAAAAIRILNGEKAGDVKTPPTRFTPPRFDWRQMQRWGISERAFRREARSIFANRPSGNSIVEFMAIFATLLLQAGLISWLIYEHRRRNRAEMLVRSSMAELTHMNRLATAGELSASIAHEVNQPITGMVLKAGAALRWLPEDMPNAEKVRGLLTDIVSAGQRAGEIVAGVRTMFKKDTNERVPVDINKIILTVLEIVRIDCEKSGVVIHTDLADELPAVSGDHVQLQQVVLNLVMNAIEAMHSTQPRILRIETRQSGPGRCVCQSETPAGIDPSNSDRVFDRLFTTKSHGMGMGLAICRSIIENHDGRIWVSNAAGRGSVFHFELPAESRTVAR